jgi:nucleoside-diphosphate-sugar epimerase
MNEIKDSKVLITGGAGFVGSTIADQLFDLGAAEVRVLDNFVRGSRRNLERAQAPKLPAKQLTCSLRGPPMCLRAAFATM